MLKVTKELWPTHTHIQPQYKGLSKGCTFVHVCVCTFVSSLPLALLHIIVISCIVNLSQICGYICMYVEPWYVYNWSSAWFVWSCQPLLPALLFLKPICITVRTLIVVHVEFNQLQLENAYKTTDNFMPFQILFGLLNKREKPKLGRVTRHLSIEPCTAVENIYI